MDGTARSEYDHWNEDGDYMWYMEVGRFTGDEDPPELPDWDEIDEYDQAFDAGYEAGYHGEPFRALDEDVYPLRERNAYQRGYDEGTSDRTAADDDNMGW